MKKTSILFFSSPSFSGNAKALYDYIQNNMKDVFNIYWAVKDIEDYNRLKDITNCVIYPSEEFKEFYKNIDIAFTTHGQLINEDNRSVINVNLWHGIGPKKSGYMLSENNIAKSDDEFLYKLEMNTDYLIVPSEFWRLIFSSQFKANYNRVLSLGYPKFDSMVYSDGKKNLEKLIGNKLKDFNKIVLYTPTFKKGLGRKDSSANSNNIFDFDQYKEETLLHFLEENKTLLLIKHHPYDEVRYKEVKHNNVFYLTESLLASNGLNVYDLLNACDLLITDYSSLGTEFSFMKKPVIYLNNKQEEYMTNHGIMFDNNDFWADITASSIKELMEKIKSCKKEHIIDKYDLFYGNLKDGGNDKIVNYFFKKNGEIKKEITKFNHFSEKEVEKNKKTISKLNEELKSSYEHAENLQNELKIIKNSKFWKIRSFFRK